MDILRIFNKRDKGKTIQPNNVEGPVTAKKIEKLEQYFGTPPKTDLFLRYLKEVASETNHLPWASLYPDYADPSRGEALGLADIYTALDTTELEKPESEDEVREYLIRQKDSRRISAHEMINNRSRLVLLGDPGSGKSTLVNYLAYVMAEAGQNYNAAEWLDRLKKTSPWDHGALLPVRVILREFAARLDEQEQEGRAGFLVSHIQDGLRTAGLEDFWQDLQDCLLDPQAPCLILLDGLDEVPSDLRQIVVRAINDFAGKYKDNRYIVTCRIYAYIGQDYQLQGFHQATLTPFNQEQIESFITAWYHELSVRKRFTKKDADARANRLKVAAIRPDLFGLAERPLLMTVMALLHSFRGQLPDDRVEFCTSGALICSFSAGKGGWAAKKG